MNFFFGLKSSFLSSSIIIPKFQNYGILSKDLRVFEANIENDMWIIKETQVREKDNFFFIDEENIDNHKIFFLAQKKNFQNESYFYNQLVEFNNFTKTLPVSFRANLKIFNKSGGYSSYQSDYPFSMTKINGNILSPLNMLLNKDSEKNYIYFRNIYYKPLMTSNYLYIVNYNKKKILEKIKIKKNFTNEIEISNNYISNEIYLYSDDCIGIPLFVSINNSHLSFEHTHPPHHYILSPDRYKTINKLKNEFKNIIN